MGHGLNPWSGKISHAAWLKQTNKKQSKQDIKELNNAIYKRFFKNKFILQDI